MPVKNAAPFLDETLLSIIAQSFQNWELIVVDDGSTDRSREIIQNYQRVDDRVHLYLNQEDGIIPALAMAFEHTSGSFITRMDADDRMPPKKLEQLLSICTRDRIIATGKVRYFSTKPISRGYQEYEEWMNGLIDRETHWKSIYRECVIASPNWMVHRSCFDRDIKFKDLVYPEDYDLVLKWYAKNYSIGTVASITHYWREHPQRTSRHSIHYQQEAFFKLKTNAFIQNELENHQKTQIIGKGLKAQFIKKAFSQKKIPFEQFLSKDLLSKISDHKSYLPIEALNPNHPTILAIWPKEKYRREAILEYLTQNGFVFGTNLWLF